MKKKLRVVSSDGTVLEGEYKIRNLDHLKACQKYKATIVEDKRFKQPRYKNKIFEEN